MFRWQLQDAKNRLSKLVRKARQEGPQPRHGATCAVMSSLLDTCVLSELAMPEPDAGVVQWLGDTDETGLYFSC